MTNEMAAVAICQEMGWTYEQYLDAPVWFIEMIKNKLEIDADKISNQ